MQRRNSLQSTKRKNYNPSLNYTIYSIILFFAFIAIYFFLSKCYESRDDSDSQGLSNVMQGIEISVVDLSNLTTEQKENLNGTKDEDEDDENENEVEEKGDNFQKPIKVQLSDGDAVIEQFFLAIESDNISLITSMLDAGFDPSIFREQDGYNALHYAVLQQNAKIVRIILKRDNSFINEKTNNLAGETPLLIACNILRHSEISFDIVKMLLNYGADYNIINSDNFYTPLMFASFGSGASSLDLINLLLDVGSDVNAKTHDTLNSVLHIALRRGAPRANIKVLIYRGADRHAVSAYNRKPVHEAAYFGNVGGLRELILTHFISKEELTPLRAEGKYKEEYVGKYSFGATPLICAVAANNMEGMEFLLMIHSDLMCKDEDGNSVFSISMPSPQFSKYLKDRKEWEDYNNEIDRTELLRAEDTVRDFDEYDDEPDEFSFKSIRDSERSSFLHIFWSGKRYK